MRSNGMGVPLGGIKTEINYGEFGVKIARKWLVNNEKTQIGRNHFMLKIIFD
jgi:hypothetical protein